MKNSFRTIRLFLLLGGLATGFSAQAAATVCWKCNITDGCYLTTWDFPGYQHCTFGAGQCTVSGSCPNTFQSSVTVAGTVVSYGSVPVSTRSDVRTGRSDRLNRGAEMAATSWRTDCRGRIVARSMGPELAVVLRADLREINI